MKLLIQISLLLFLASVVGCSSEFNDGMKVFKKKDYKVAFDKWKPLAEPGHDDAQYKIGKLYREGLGLSKTISKPTSGITLYLKRDMAVVIDI